MPKYFSFDKTKLPKGSEYRKQLKSQEERNNRKEQSQCLHTHEIRLCSHCQLVLGSEKLREGKLLIKQDIHPMEETNAPIEEVAVPVQTETAPETPVAEQGL